MLKMNIKKNISNKILVPISALSFYFIILLLISIEVLPPAEVIIDFLRELYALFGYRGLFISTFLESIIYVGLYFPGSLIIVFSVILSEGTIIEFLIISSLVSLSITLGNCINYYLGKKKLFLQFFKKHKPNSDIFSNQHKHITSWKNFLICFLHPSLLAFYSFYQGLENKSPYFLLYIFPLMFLWGFFLCFVIYSLRDFFIAAAQNPLLLMLIFVVLIILIIAVMSLKKNK